MPKMWCKYCRKMISYSKVDKFEKIHKCFEEAFEERIVVKPAIGRKKERLAVEPEKEYWKLEEPQDEAITPDAE